MFPAIFLVVIVVFVTGQNPIIDIDRLGPGDSFNITCDVSRFLPDAVPRVQWLWSLSVQRKLEWELSYEPIAVYEPKSLVQKHTQNIPPNRLWDIRFSGGEVSDNINTIRIVVHVLDGGYRDAGLYRCCMEVFGVGKPTCTEPSRLTATGTESVGRVVSSGQSTNLIIECDIFKFRPSDVSVLRWLPVIGAERLLQGAHNYTLMVCYEPMLEDVKKKKRTVIPRGSDWTLRYYGGETLINKNILRIVVVLKNADCRDTGLYRCFKVSPGRTSRDYSEPFNFTAEAQVQNAHLDVMYQANDYLPGISSVTLTCLVTGPIQIKIDWRIIDNVSDQEMDSPSMDVLEAPPPQRHEDRFGCSSFTHKSLMTFKTENFSDGQVFVCAIQKDGVVHTRLNFTYRSFNFRNARAQADGAQQNHIEATLYVAFILLTASQLYR